MAADLTAETFASAIVAQHRFDPGRAPAVAWLFSIATRRLADYQRRGQVDQRVRRSLRIEAGRVVRRIAVDPRTLPTLAGARGALWTVSQQTRQGYRLARIDTDTGRTTATVALGPHRPQALVRSPGGLWVVAGDGNALLVRAGSP